MTAGRPLLGLTDMGELPHMVARVGARPYEACCGAELVSVPNHQPEVGEYDICRACRHSGVTPLPHNYYVIKDDEQ